ncbi:hypothetical protein NPIL_688321 [Nephila pilipes]|uniref:Uncharacterized protein n=1 Tax=Nephila pilipes TaxID=299642 RepID=A0A8X6QMX0_NEPPI|nr:hypothetical protein NPIL_688321 [Nephila pilipes]
MAEVAGLASVGRGEYRRKPNGIPPPEDTYGLKDGHHLPGRKRSPVERRKSENGGHPANCAQEQTKSDISAGWLAAQSRQAAGAKSMKWLSTGNNEMNSRRQLIRIRRS